MPSLNLTLTITTLALFLIVIMIGYVYVDESRKNSQEAKDAIVIVNKTQAKFLDEWKQKQVIDNVRFNRTLNGLGATYDLILDNQKLIINLSDSGSQNTQRNLNLTKFNRASLIDTNDKVTEIMKILNQTR